MADQYAAEIARGERTQDGHFTVAGLIAELQRHIEIDPARAHQVVEVVEAGRSGRTRPVVAAGMGAGDDQRVGLICRRP